MTILINNDVHIWHLLECYQVQYLTYILYIYIYIYIYIYMCVCVYKTARLLYFSLKLDTNLTSTYLSKLDLSTAEICKYTKIQQKLYLHGSGILTLMQNQQNLVVSEGTTGTLGY